MLVTSDSFGEWYQLGFIKPVDYNKWYDLTPEHDVHSGRYRFNFTCDQFDRIHSYCWVRSVYIKDELELYSQSRKVYPHPVPLDVAMPIPADYRSQGVGRQRLQLKKLLRPRTSSDYLWTLRIEELYVPAQQLEGIEENLEAVSKRIDKLQQTIEFVAQRDIVTTYNIDVS